MKKYLLVIVALTSILLTGCVSGITTPVSTDTNAATASREAYKVAKEYQGEVWTYECADGYTPVDIAIGDTIQRDGSSYKLKENKEYGKQVSVTLTIKLADNQIVPALIVDNSYHPENPAAGQRLYQPQLQAGSSLTVTLPRDGFGGGENGIWAITKATACTKYLGK